MNNEEQLKKLAQIFNAEKLVTTEDVAAVLKGVMEIMASFKRNNEVLTTETKEIVSDLLAKVKEQSEKLSKSVSNETTNIRKDIEVKLKEVKLILKEVKSIKLTPGKDGLDAEVDEEKIVKDVLNKIELPKYKETILDGRQEIVEKINTGKKNDTLIDVAQIGGLTKMESDILQRALSILDQRTQFLINKNVKHDSTLTGAGTDASPLSVVGGGGGTPGGSTTQVQFNDSGSFRGDSAFVWDKTNDFLRIGTGTPAYPLHIQRDGVVATGDFKVLSRITDSTASYGIIAGYDSSQGTGIIASTGTYPLSLRTFNGANYVDALSIDSNQIVTIANKLGIGGIVPAYPLDVKGTASNQISFGTGVDSGGYLASITTATAYLSEGCYFNGSNWYSLTSYQAIYEMTSGGHNWYANVTGANGPFTPTLIMSLSYLGVLVVGSTISATNLSGTNTGDQDLSPYATISSLSAYALLSGATFAGAISATNLSGTNTGDQDLSGYQTTAGLDAAVGALNYLKSIIDTTAPTTVNGFLFGSGGFISAPTDPIAAAESISGITPAADNTYALPTSITISHGIITAIS